MNSNNQETANIKKKNKLFFDANQQPFMELLTFIDFVDNKLNIGLVEINSAQDRDILITALINHPNYQDIQFEILDFPDPSLRFLRDQLVAALKQIDIATNKKLILLVTGLEKSIDILKEYPDVLVNLNFVRDDLRSSVPHTLLLFLPDYALTRLAKYAPDFWAWTRKVFYFKTVKSTLDKPIDNTIFSARIIDTLELPEKQKKIELLLGLLTEYNFSDKQRNQRDLQACIDIYHQLGNVYYSLEEYQQAIDFHQKSLAIKRQIGDRHGEAKSLNNLGSAYKALGKYQQAIESLHQSLAIFQQIGDSYGEANSLNNLGNAYDLLGEYQRAIDLLQQSLAIFQQIGDCHGEANSLTNLGSAYYSLGEYQRSIDCLQQSLAIFQHIGDRRGEANSLTNLGSAYYSLGEYQRAIDCLQQSLAIFQQIGDKRNEANTWFNLGIARKNMEQNLDAKIAYDNARKLYQTMELDKDVDKCATAIQNLANNDLS